MLEQKNTEDDKSGCKNNIDNMDYLDQNRCQNKQTLSIIEVDKNDTWITLITKIKWIRTYVATNMEDNKSGFKVIMEQG